MDKEKEDGEDGDEEDAQRFDREQRHFSRVLGAFAGYAVHAGERIRKAEVDFLSIPLRHQQLLPEFRAKLDLLRRNVRRNQTFLDCLTLPHLDFHVEDESRRLVYVAASPTDEDDYGKVRSVLKQCVRDWSSDGKHERDPCYQPILDEIRSYFSDALAGHSAPRPRVLVPGCGLGRLAYEICKLNCDCQGNEFSYFMLLTSNFLLNSCRAANQFEIAPWVLHFSNSWSVTDQLRIARIPDEVPHLPPGIDFSMLAGDFLEIYRDQSECWDCVVTCFFIDTAKNIIEYVEQISRLLKPNGLWINKGPLLYHFENHRNEHSVELSHAELLSVIEHFGLTIQKQSRSNLPYVGNEKSMLQTIYDCSFFTAVKGVATKT